MRMAPSRVHARVSASVYSKGRGVQSAPEIVGAVASLRLILTALQPDPLTGRMLAVAATTWAWGELGAGAKASHAGLQEADTLLNERSLALAVDTHRRRCP